MKNIIFLIAIVSVLNFSCAKDDSLDPRPDLVAGQFVTLQITNGRIDANNLSTSGFEGILEVPAKNVDKYEMYVARRNGFAFVSDYVLLNTFTSFPAKFKVTSADVQAVGIPALVDSDNLRFFGRSYKNGVMTDFNSLSGALRASQAQRQAYRFYTDVTTRPNEKLENQYTW